MRLSILKIPIAGGISMAGALALVLSMPIASAAQ